LKTLVSTLLVADVIWERRRDWPQRIGHNKLAAAAVVGWVGLIAAVAVTSRW
jgi:hypothetical protein